MRVTECGSIGAKKTKQTIDLTPSIHIGGYNRFDAAR